MRRKSVGQPKKERKAKKRKRKKDPFWQAMKRGEAPCSWERLGRRCSCWSNRDTISE